MGESLLCGRGYSDAALEEFHRGWSGATDLATLYMDEEDVTISDDVITVVVRTSKSGSSSGVACTITIRLS